jgi:prolyl oligopeptidase PreP (S9A serine peptidase family)
MVGFFMLSCKNSESEKSNVQLKYPTTKKVDTVTNYFGTDVKDPYRWLEDDMSDETAEWVGEQNKVTFDYLAKIPYREELKNRLEKLWNYEKIGAPFKEGDYTYFYKNNGLQNQYVIYRHKENEDPEVFLDPNTFSEDGTTSLGGLSFSKDGKKTQPVMCWANGWLDRNGTPSIDINFPNGGGENLKEAISGETFEFTEMYPAMIEESKEDGNKTAERNFTYANEVEKVHASLYQKALDNLDNMDETDYYVCSVCGYTCEVEPPEKCPVCSAKSTAFFKVE